VRLYALVIAEIAFFVGVGMPLIFVSPWLTLAALFPLFATLVAGLFLMAWWIWQEADD
jgi:hypothetical protein